MRYRKEKQNIHYCDYCLVEMRQGKFETLTDGRERCRNCAQTDINTEEQILELFEETLQNMEKIFNIHIDEEVKISIIDANTIAQKLKDDHEFVCAPTGDFGQGTVSIVDYDVECYVIYVDQGAPKNVMISCFIAGLTFIWQDKKWNGDDILSRYGELNLGAIYEGMSIWAEIQYMLLTNDKEYAKRLEWFVLDFTENDDICRLGYLEYKRQFPLSESIDTMQKTPFQKIPPLELPMENL